MMNYCCDRQPEIDLAGQIYHCPNYWQIQKRINFSIAQYLSSEKLRDRLEDLPIQFIRPQPRAWKSIDWQTIQQNQIIGIDLEVFLSIVAGAIDTEAPIRGYTQTSRQYLREIHPQLARFVGGIVENGNLIEPGLWEKEERQHTPALMKIYAQLTGRKITPNFRHVRNYQPSQNPRQDLYYHGLHRIATEYGATCLYLWLMAHTTGTLQAVLEELLLDEINHMTKFWGFGVWAYPDSSLRKVGTALIRTINWRSIYNPSRSSLIGTLHRMTEVLAWNNWSLTNKTTFAYCTLLILNCMRIWAKNLTPEYLQNLFGVSLFKV